MAGEIIQEFLADLGMGFDTDELRLEALDVKAGEGLGLPQLDVHRRAKVNPLDALGIEKGRSR